MSELTLDTQMFDVPEMKSKVTPGEGSTLYVQQGCVDYFLISDELQPEINGVRINSSYRPDHSLVSLELILKTENRKRN